MISHLNRTRAWRCLKSDGYYELFVFFKILFLVFWGVHVFTVYAVYVLFQYILFDHYTCRLCMRGPKMSPLFLNNSVHFWLIREVYRLLTVWHFKLHMHRPILYKRKKITRKGGSRILQGRVSKACERGTGGRALKAPREVGSRDPEKFCISYIKMVSFYAFPEIFIDSALQTGIREN